MRKQEGMHLICFHFGFQIQTPGFSLEGSGVFLGMAEDAVPVQSGAWLGVSRAGEGPQQGSEMLPAADAA